MIERTRIRLTLEATAPEADAMERLRGLLKIALRSFGFRCLKIEKLGDDLSPLEEP